MDANTATTLDRGNIILNKATFKDKNAGFSFWEVSVKGVDEAISHFDKLTSGKGKEIVVDLVNFAIKSKMRVKASNKLPNDAGEKAKKLVSGGSLLITTDEAEAYIPGDREPTSQKGIFAALQDVMSDIRESKAAYELAVKEGRTEDAANIKSEVDALKVKGRALNAQLDDLNSVLS